MVPQDTTAAQLLRSGQVTLRRADQPVAVAVLQGRSGHHRRRAPRPGRTCSRSSTPRRGRCDQTVRQAISYGIDYHGIIAALHGGADPPVRRRPAGPVRPRRPTSELHLRPGQGGPTAEAGRLRPAASEDLNLSLTYTKGDSNEQVVATLMKSNLAEAERQPGRARRSRGRPSGRRASRRTRPSARTSSSSTGGRTTPTRTRGSPTCCRPRTRRTSTCRTTRTLDRTSRSER